MVPCLPPRRSCSGCALPAGFVPTRARIRPAPARPTGRALALLLGVICFRSLAWFGLLTFVPLWEVSLGHSKAYGNHLLSLMLLAGAIGTLVAGPSPTGSGSAPVLIASDRAHPADPLFVVVGGSPAPWRSRSSASASAARSASRW